MQNSARCALARFSTSLVAITLMGGCSAQIDADSGTDSIQQPVTTLTIDVRRSLVVTEQTILARFSLQRVLNQLATQAAVPGVGATQLFQQWWDTQNSAPGTYSGPHCNDQV